MNTISKRIVLNFLILFLCLITSASNALAQQTVTHTDQYGRVVWSIHFPSDPTKDATGIHYMYNPPDSTSAKLYAKENVQFSYGFKPSDLPTTGDFYGSSANYIVRSKYWYDQNGNMVWFANFPSDPNQDVTGVHYMYFSSNNNSIGNLYAIESVRFHYGFRSTDLPRSADLYGGYYGGYESTANYIVTSKYWYDRFGRIEWTATFPMGINSEPYGVHYIYSNTESPSTALFALELVQYQYGFKASDLPRSGDSYNGAGSGSNYRVSSKNWYDRNGRIEWTASFPLDPNKPVTGSHYIFTSTDSIYSVYYAIESVEYVYGFKSSDIPSSSSYGGYYYGNSSNYRVTSKTWYDPKGRIEWSANFPLDPNKAVTGMHYVYLSPDSSSTALYATENIQYTYGFKSSDLPSNGNYYGGYGSSMPNYLVTSKTYYNSIGKIEWVITFPSNSTSSPIGRFYAYNSDGKISYSNIVRFPVTFKPSDPPQNGFYTKISTNYLNSRGITEWVVNFPSNPASNPTGYHFIFDSAGVFRQLDYLIYNPYAPTSEVPYMQYTITKSVKY